MNIISNRFEKELKRPNHDQLHYIYTSGLTSTGEESQSSFADDEGKMTWIKTKKRVKTEREREGGVVII